MKNITTQEAYNLIESSSAIVIDNVVTYPHVEELIGEADQFWLDIIWEDDGNEYSASFDEDCGDIKFDGTNLWLKDIEGDEQRITLLVKMKVEL